MTASHSGNTPINGAATHHPIGRCCSTRWKMTNRFAQLVHGYSLAKATVRKMKHNTVIALGTVVVLLAGVLAQQVFMATCMLIYEMSVIVVILNAVRLVSYRSRSERRSTPTTPAGPRSSQRESHSSALSSSRSH